jgi:hypothetical protein
MECDNDCDMCAACERCGEVSEDNVVHSWGCVKLCAKCAVNEDGTPHCPKDDDDECEHCYPVCDECGEKNCTPESCGGDPCLNCGKLVYKGFQGLCGACDWKCYK